jgi:murein DD-endopeptidase MepM/ murein hydrolase activator NlpD
MFTVFNRDVILRISISLLLLVIISPSPVLARSIKANYDKKTKLYSNHNKYLKGKKSQKKKEKSSKKNISAISQNHKDSIKKASPKKNNALYYKVKKGDTLTHISKRYNIPIASILSFNNLKNENKIKKGFILKIPAGQSASAISRKNIVNKQKSYGSLAPRFRWPVDNVIDYHNDGVNGVKPIGIVITGKAGSTVLSSASGTVKKIGSMRGFGKYIVIHHSGRFATVYANLDQITVSEGDKIQGGNAIGRINNSDRKLHFQIDLEGKPENPLKYLPKNI